MKILLSAFSCGPNKGSEQGVGWNWALEVARLGHEVVCLTETAYQKPIEAERATGRLPPTLRFAFFMPGWLDRLRRYGMRTGLESVTAHLVHFIWQVLAYRHVRRHLLGEGFDLVHHITYSGIRHPTLMGRLPIPLVLGPLGGGERAPYPVRRGLPWKGWLRDAIRDVHTLLIRFDPITRRACADALVVYVKTEQSRDALPRRFHPKIAVQMEVGIDEPPPAPKVERAPDEPFRLLYLGRFLYWKGTHLGIEALAEVLRRGGDVRLTIAGKGPDEGFWRRLAADLGIEHAIDWPGWIEHGRVGELYLGHDALIFPSLHDSSGNAVLESLSRGLPVICLDLGGPGTIVDQRSGRVVATAGRSENEVVRGLADAIEEMSRSPELCRTLAEGALARAGEFRWSARVATIYDDIERRLSDAAGEHADARPGRAAA